MPWLGAVLEGATSVPTAQATGYDDWDNLHLDFQRSPNFAISSGDAGFGADPEPELGLDRAIADGIAFTHAFPEGAKVLPGCASPVVPVAGAGLRVPVVLPTRPGESYLDLSEVWLSNAAWVTRRVDTDVDGDGDLDLWLEFDPTAMTMLGSSAVRLDLYGVRPIGQSVFVQFPITRAAVSDADGDGIHDACDACPAVGGANRRPNGCPP